MKSQHEIQFSKLLGFSNIKDKLGAGAVDFRDAAVDARLGAKVGAPKIEKSEPADSSSQK